MKRAVWLFLLLLPAGCGPHTPADTAKGEKKAPPPVVQVLPIATGTLERTLPATGTLLALRDHEAALSPPAAGVVDSLPIRFGQTVARGQVIAHLSTRQLLGQIVQARATLGQNLVQVEQAQANAVQQQAQTRTAILQARAAVSGAQATLSGAQATLTGALAALRNAEQSLARQRALFADGLVAQKDVEAAVLAVRTAQAQVDAQRQTVAAQAQTVAGQRQAVAAAEAASLQDVVKRNDIKVARQQVRNAEGALATAQAQMALYTIRSPLAGEVTQLGASVGETVDTTTKLATVSDLRTLQLQIGVPGSVARQVRPGEPVSFTVTGLPGRIFRTTVSAVASQVDAATGTVSVLAVVVNPRRLLKDDSTVKVQIVTERRTNVLLVPQAAVLTDPDTGKTSVVVVGSDNVAHVTPVTTGLAANGQVEITQGLSSGQKVAVAGHYGLPDGTKVEVQNAHDGGSPPAAATENAQGSGSPSVKGAAAGGGSSGAGAAGSSPGAPAPAAPAPGSASPPAVTPPSSATQPLVPNAPGAPGPPAPAAPAGPSPAAPSSSSTAPASSGPSGSTSHGP